MEPKKILNLQQIKELKLEVLVKMSDLAIAGFGLVAALAWNEAIQSLFNYFLPKTTSGGLIAQLLYAALVTVIVVLVIIKLGRMMAAAKADLDKYKINNR